MTDTSRDNHAALQTATGRGAELLVFAIVAAIIWPIIAIGVVGGYGFLVWMSQLILGPQVPRISEGIGDANFRAVAPFASFRAVRQPTSRGPRNTHLQRHRLNPSRQA